MMAMKNKILLISILLFMVVFFTALYIVFGTLRDYKTYQTLGEYTQQMMARDVAYIRLHKIPTSWLFLVMFSLGYMVRVLSEWVFKDDTV